MCAPAGSNTRPYPTKRDSTGRTRGFGGEEEVGPRLPSRDDWRERATRRNRHGWKSAGAEGTRALVLAFAWRAGSAEAGGYSAEGTLRMQMRAVLHCIGGLSSREAASWPGCSHRFVWLATQRFIRKWPQASWDAGGGRGTPLRLTAELAGLLR